MYSLLLMRHILVLGFCMRSLHALQACASVPCINTMRLSAPNANERQCRVTAHQATLKEMLKDADRTYHNQWTKQLQLAG